MTQEWNPEKAGAELKALFDKADEIFSKPIYQEASADRLHSSSADSLPTTRKEPIVKDFNQS